MRFLILSLLTCFLFSSSTDLFSQDNLMGVGDVKKPLTQGSSAPDFVGYDQNYEKIRLQNLLEKGDVVLIFYRGVWCPYCRQHLGELQDNLQFVLDEGASVVVVTPEQPEYIDEMISRTGATFSIIHDEDYQIMRSYNTAFRISEKTVNAFRKLTMRKATESNGNQEGILPVPATYIIDKTGKIKYVHFDKDYSNRANVPTILKHL